MIQFSEKINKKIGPKLFRPKAYPAQTFSNWAYPATCMSSELLRACCLLAWAKDVRSVFNGNLWMPSGRSVLIPNKTTLASMLYCTLGKDSFHYITHFYWDIILLHVQVFLIDYITDVFHPNMALELVVEFQYDGKVLWHEGVIRVWNKYTYEAGF